MSWKAGNGDIAWGRGSTVRETVTIGKEDVILPKDNPVVVMKADFKLIKQDKD